MRLGSYPCTLTDGTNAHRAYGSNEIHERHRHRYEYNNEYRERLVDGGLKISGICPGRDLVEVVEIEDHPWFLGCQYHPEFKSRPWDAHPLFADFIFAATKKTK